MSTITFPETWQAPKFALGQTVYHLNTDNEQYVIVGMRYANFRILGTQEWTYQLARQRDLSEVQRLSGDESDLSAAPWPIEGETCPGLQFPCGKPAAYWFVSHTGGDFETARRVDLAYCPECWAELNEGEA